MRKIYANKKIIIIISCIVILIVFLLSFINEEENDEEIISLTTFTQTEATTKYNKSFYIDVKGNGELVT